MADPENQIIHRFVRTQDEEIQFCLRKYRGQYYIDLRLWFQPKAKGPFRPTKKGVFFSLEHALELKRGADRMLEAVEALLKTQKSDEKSKVLV